MRNNNLNLRFFGLPIIETIEDFSNLTHVSESKLFHLSKFSDKYYTTYEIPKKNGEKRIISQPSKELKGIQAWILNSILYKLSVSSSSKGFEKNTSTNDNVNPHVFCNAILSLDIEDFFPSIDRKKVFNVFRLIGYNNLISTILTNLCIYNNNLPQGSPCSPRLANLILWRMDIRLQNYLGRRSLTYTRYADDLSISGLSPKKVINCYPMVKHIIEDEGFKLNKKKTRMSGNARAKKITGLILYDDKYGIGHKKVKDLRSKIFHLTLPDEQNNLKLLSHVQGWLNYLNSVDKIRLAKLELYIKKLKLKIDNTLIDNLHIPLKK